MDAEFKEALNRLSSTCGLTSDGFVGCDDTLVTGEGEINTNSVDWR